jgi:hypothetical protein
MKERELLAQAKPLIIRALLLMSCGSLLFVFTTITSAAERQVLHGHLVRAVTELHLQTVGRLASSTNLNLVIGLPLRNQEALTNLLQQQYSPTSPQYHHWLTPDEFTAKFGPTEQDYQAVIDFAKANGFIITGTHSNRTLVDVRGPVADIERTFHVTLLTYQHPTEAREFYAPDVEPSLDLTVPVLHITGLDDYILPRPSITPAPPQNSAVPAYGSAPLGNYMGYDFRAAYLPNVSLTGTGQAVGLLEFDGYYANDIVSYESQTGLPNVQLQNVLLDGFDGIPFNYDRNSEVSLDIEMTISMAPGLSEVIIYEAPFGVNTDDILNQMAMDNLAKQLSSSWTYAIDTNTDQIYMQFAAQGQSFFNAAGDNDAYCGAIDQPADDLYITIVGGTVLTTTGPSGSWVSEIVWNDGYVLDEGYRGSGGGISTTYPIPIWQQGVNMSTNGGSMAQRNVPDVAMVADDVWVIHDNGGSGAFDGTSCSTPLWASVAALVNQQRASTGLPPIGFFNPAIYAIGEGSGYTAAFHDIATGNNSGLLCGFYAVPGYDLCTGWGTPNGSGLIDALSAPPKADLTRSTDQLSNLNPEAGETVTASITITNQSCPVGGASAGAFFIGFYWSSDSNFFGVSEFHEAPVSGCPKSGSVTITQNVTISTGTTPGVYYLGYNIDDSNDVAECDKENNGIFYWPVTVLPPCTFSLSATNTTFGAVGGFGSVSVTATNSCAWTATSNDGFITIISGNSGIGNGIVSYSVAANASTDSLLGTMTIAGQTFTVTQLGVPTCGFTLSTTSAMFDAAGGSGSVSVTASNGCAWTATSDDGFIAIISGNSGIGNGTVNYSVAANTSTSSLTGIMTVAGQAFTVIQSGAPGVPSGDINYAFTNTPLWDASGIYTNNTDTNDVVIESIQQQANGKITGVRTETYVNGMDQADASGPVTGKVFVRAGVVGASVKSSGGITGVSGGVDYTGAYSEEDTEIINPSSLTIYDSGSTRICIVGEKCDTGTSADTVPLPAGMNGNWELDISVAANGNKRTGTGTLTLSNGRVLTYQIIGSYNARNQLSKLKLVGESEATGSSLSLTTYGAGMDLTGLTGNVLGQPLKYP